VVSLIYDCFLFHNELDILECRLRELDNIPLKHVVVEAAVTHQGEPKPFYYAENKERFSAWEDKIIHVMLTKDDLDQPGDNHRMAIAHRRLITRGLEDAVPDDLILLCDVDEIPRAEVAKSVPSNTVLELSFHNFAVDWLHPLPWCGPVAAQAKDITDLEQLRNMRHVYPRISNAGWHFSWLGGVEAIKRKALDTSHTETTDQMLKWADLGVLYQQGFTWEDGKPFGLTARMRPTGLDDLPLWIKERKCPPEWFRPQSTLVFARGRLYAL
jgi:hypothetical protein